LGKAQQNVWRSFYSRQVANKKLKALLGCFATQEERGSGTLELNPSGPEHWVEL